MVGMYSKTPPAFAFWSKRVIANAELSKCQPNS
jgi:hypothetical protein